MQATQHFSRLSVASAILRHMRRLVCLDGLRGVLAFYVMLSHSLPFLPLPHWLHWMFQHGGAGVDVFFVLSGLVIVQSLASFDTNPCRS